MSKKKLVFNKKSGAEKRIERFEAKIGDYTIPLISDPSMPEGIWLVKYLKDSAERAKERDDAEREAFGKTIKELYSDGPFYTKGILGMIIKDGEATE